MFPTSTLVAAALAVATMLAGATSPPWSGHPTVELSMLSASSAADERPNIVLVVTDDMRADDLAYMPRTRELIGDAGATFTKFISPHPLCCPARAGILTAQYAQNHGVQHNRGERGGYGAFDPSATLATWMQQAGYRTAMHGKHLNFYKQSDGRDPGWDMWDPLVGGVFHYRNFRFYDGQRYTDDYVTTRISQHSNASIRRFSGPGDPFLVMVNHVAPHEAYGVSWPAKGAPPPAEERYADVLAGERSPSFSHPSYNEQDVSDKPVDLRLDKVETARMQDYFLGRIRSLQSVDDAVASLYDTLRDTGELDNTYVIFTSDNGYALGEHRFFKKNKVSQEVLSVPLLVAGPGITAGTRIDRISTLVDLSVTMLDIADVEPSLPSDGLSLLGPLQGLPMPWRDTTLVQTGDSSRSGFQPGWRYRGVQTKRYLYGISVNHPTNEFLYDRSLDPAEMDSVVHSPAYRLVRSELRRRAYELMVCSGPDCNQQFGPVPQPTE